MQYVQISYGPWAREQRGRPRGPGRPVPQRQRRRPIVFRNGMAIPATWHRSTLGSPTQFVNASGSAHPAQARHRRGWSWCPTPSRRRRRRSARRRPRPSTARLAGLRATTASSRQSSAAAKTPGCALASASSNTPAGHAAPHQVEALALGHLEAGPLELGHQLVGARTRSCGRGSSARPNAAATPARWACRGRTIRRGPGPGRPRAPPCRRRPR